SGTVSPSHHQASEIVSTWAMSRPRMIPTTSAMAMVTPPAPKATTAGSHQPPRPSGFVPIVLLELDVGGDGVADAFAAEEDRPDEPDEQCFGDGDVVGEERDRRDSDGVPARGFELRHLGVLSSGWGGGAQSSDVTWNS